MFILFHIFLLNFLSLICFIVYAFICSYESLTKNSFKLRYVIFLWFVASLVVAWFYVVDRGG